jgi:hypothetical protein
MMESQAGSVPSPSISKKKLAALGATAVATFYSATVALGYYYGRTRSVDWNDTLAITQFINSNHSVKYLRKSQESDISGGDPIELTLRIGDRQYVYSTSTDKVQFEVLSPEEIARLPKPRKHSQTDEEKLMIAVGAIVTPSYAGLSESRWLIKRLSHLKGKQLVAVVVPAAVLGAGVAWGYSMGYKPFPDYSSEAFQNAIQDPKRWRPLAQHYRTHNSDKMH